MPTKINLWWPLHTADYLQRTILLSLEEQGAYVRLLNQIWHTQAPLRDDDAVFAKILNVTRPRWRKLRPNLEPLFEIEGGLWTCGWLEQEQAKAKAATERRKSAANIRWSRERKKHASAYAMHVQSMSNAYDNHNYIEEKTTRPGSPPSPSSEAPVRPTFGAGDEQ
jgi:uncharacterized protein YdaU (DUF1376 family)